MNLEVPGDFARSSCYSHASNNKKRPDKDDLPSELTPLLQPSFERKHMDVVEGQLTIKTITGTTFTVDLCPGASVSSLKILIEVCRGIPEKDQNL